LERKNGEIYYETVEVNSTMLQNYWLLVCS